MLLYDGKIIVGVNTKDHNYSRINQANINTKFKHYLGPKPLHLPLALPIPMNSTKKHLKELIRHILQLRHVQKKEL